MGLILHFNPNRIFFQSFISLTQEYYGKTLSVIACENKIKSMNNEILRNAVVK